MAFDVYKKIKGGTWAYSLLSIDDEEQLIVLLTKDQADTEYRVYRHEDRAAYRTIHTYQIERLV